MQTNHRTAERKKRSRPISEINVTPFVDVMLVLLVVFMVTAPLLVLGIPVQLPKVSKEYIIADDDTPLNVEVDEGKRIYINKKEIDNKVDRRLSSLLKNLVYPARTDLVEILLAIKPRLRQNADIKRKCPNSLTIIGTSLKTYFQKSNLIFKLFDVSNINDFNSKISLIKKKLEFIIWEVQILYRIMNLFNS